ncbi:P2X purinoceptor 7 isoform X1 [Micropterus dolomieu]|uniref:P2X purinoceptor 7 isoform X1 n=1 Tax=Micropterus dolomieu TaxID=147949 RepID=UPI001E8DE7E0|nr:P2X purinoceptor 7 isoform X1 [Micropterus dolomieu]XP_045925779.1 P2X purinoceptor 7 isoform X1 [Micropterus dolomieu]XP_045925786.1 P2X purinoceptor 7 isoform X1 [Micropterus dolomieu]
MRCGLKWLEDVLGGRSSVPELIYGQENQSESKSCVAVPSFHAIDTKGTHSVYRLTQRVTQDVSEWCACENCSTMPTEVENVCCQEIRKVVRRMQQVPDPPTCMVHHPGLEPKCLNYYTLQNIHNIYQADYGPLRRRTEEERYKHLAYRSFVSWCWGYLGRSVRVVIPSCVVLRIRQQFPDPEGQYVGFRPPLN